MKQSERPESTLYFKPQIGVGKQPDCSPEAHSPIDAVSRICRFYAGVTLVVELILVVVSLSPNGWHSLVYLGYLGLTAFVMLGAALMLAQSPRGRLVFIVATIGHLVIVGFGFLSLLLVSGAGLLFAGQRGLDSPEMSMIGGTLVKLALILAYKFVGVMLYAFKYVH